MTLWILVALATYLATVFAAMLVHLPAEGLMNRLGSRDAIPEPAPVTARLNRALHNHKESLFLFLPLAILAMISPTADIATALFGAQIYVIARIAYVPAYAISLFGTRSVIWFVSLIGLGMMALALI